MKGKTMIDGYFEHEYDELDAQIDRHIEGMYAGHIYDEGDDD